MKKIFTTIVLTIATMALTLSIAFAAEVSTDRFESTANALTLTEMLTDKTPEMTVSLTDGFAICQKVFGEGFMLDPALIWGSDDMALTTDQACKLVRSGAEIPLLNPTVYHIDANDAELYTAKAFHFVDEDAKADKAISLAEFVDLIYRVRLPVEPIVAPATDDGIKFHTAGLNNFQSIIWVQDAKICLSYVPNKLIRDFNEKGYEITIMPWETYNEMWEENWGTNEINSIACYSVDGGFLWSSELTVDTLSHEMGHHLQMWFGDYEAYETIYNEEIDNICAYLDWDYGKTDLDEGFAVSFETYIVDAQGLKEIAPKTFDYIERTLACVPE